MKRVRSDHPNIRLNGGDQHPAHRALHHVGTYSYGDRGLVLEYEYMPRHRLVPRHGNLFSFCYVVYEELVCE